MKRLIAGLVLMLTVIGTFVDVSSPFQGAVHERINQFNPQNPDHQKRVNTALYICNDKYVGTLKDGILGIEKYPQIVGEKRLMAAYQKAVEEAGQCAYLLSFSLTLADVKKGIPSLDENYQEITSSYEYKRMLDSATTFANKQCKALRYSALRDVDKMPVEEITTRLLQVNVFCMSLLGYQTAITTAVNYYRVTLD